MLAPAQTSVGEQSDAERTVHKLIDQAGFLKIDLRAILRTADYLRKNKYHKLVKLYSAAAVDCKGGKYPEEKAYLLPDIGEDGYFETVWKFYADLIFIFLLQKRLPALFLQSDKNILKNT